MLITENVAKTLIANGEADWTTDATYPDLGQSWRHDSRVTIHGVWINSHALPSVLAYVATDNAEPLVPFGVLDQGGPAKTLEFLILTTARSGSGAPRTMERGRSGAWRAEDPSCAHEGWARARGSAVRTGAGGRSGVRLSFGARMSGRRRSVRRRRGGGSQRALKARAAAPADERPRARRRATSPTASCCRR